MDEPFATYDTTYFDGWKTLDVNEENFIKGHCSPSR